ncbi:hypothetical protein Tco_1503624 [Tanacetum coccineum]
MELHDVSYGIDNGLEVDSIRRIQWVGYGVLGISWSRDDARIRRIFFDGYGVLVFRIVFFKISSLKLPNARLLLIFTKYYLMLSKRKATDGVGGSGLPPKKLREDHGSTLAAEVGVTATVTVPFVTSFVTSTPERAGDCPTDSVTGPNLRTQKPAERFVISFDSPHEPNANAADDEVNSVVWSSVLDPAILTTAVDTMVIADTSAPVSRAGHGSGAGQVRPRIFRDSISPSVAEVDVAGPSQPVGMEISSGSFYVSQYMDSDTLRQIYIPKWNVINDSAVDDPEICQGMIDHLAPPRFFSQLRGMDYEQLLAEFNVGAARQTCFNAEIRMQLEHELRGRQRFEERCALQVNKLMERDAEIANLKT